MNTNPYMQSTSTISMLDKMQFLPIVVDAVQHLENTLPKELYYHSVDHTKRVIKKAIEFAVYENINDRDVEIITIAAAYHDTGFTIRYEKNEEIGASMAITAMKITGVYSDKEMESVGKMILSTELVSTDNGFERILKTQLAKYLLDADLSIFGDSDFLHQCELLRRERSQDFASFYKEAPLMLKGHYWFTNAASDLLDREKAKNVGRLYKFIETHNGN